MWTIVTGVDIEQLDGWVQNMTEDGQVKLSVIQEKISSMSPVEGLDVTGFKSMWKSLLKTTKATKISSDVFMKHVTEQIKKQKLTEVDNDQLDAWTETMVEDGEVKISVMEEAIDANNKSPVDGLDVTDLETVLKTLTKLKQLKIPTTTIIKNMSEHIWKQYGQKKSQEFDQLLIDKV